MKKMSVMLCTLLVFLFAPIYVHALTINIDSQVYSPSAPFTIFLSAGTYSVSVIGSGAGGDYDAWNAWGGSTVGDKGWLNAYRISSDQFGVISAGDGVHYDNALAALAGAVGTTFTLTMDGLVGFSIPDNQIRDNIGGISLDVTLAPTPEPGTIALLGLGLFGLAGIRRKMK